MKVAEARGCDLGVVSELLQAAEAGLVEAMNQQEAGSGKATTGTMMGATD